MDQTKSDTSWRCDTTWSVLSGNLETCVAFESSASLSCDDDLESEKFNSPLIMCPPTPYSSHCQITIRFAQKYEVRQVYVRSTARLYEIYYAPECQSDNEYLCTVRCSVACRDGEALRVGDAEGVNSASGKRSGKDGCAEKVGDGSNNPSGSEDEWVEVSGNGPVSAKSRTSQGRNLQDLYEATAEMNDTNPCMSLTLRLLSLQSKGCVWIDEVYVFADPVDPSISKSQIGMMGNSAGNSLMTMLLPTFFQLSKTKDVGRTQDVIGTTEKLKLKEVLSNEAGPSIGLKQTHLGGRSGEADQPEKLQDTALPPSKPVQLGNPLPVLDSPRKPDMSYSHIEGALYQLVARVNKIEELFTRFEENMLKPISSIDERLHRVEQQLEVLTGRTQSSELPSCNRISAPEFSCSESETNSYNNGSVHLSSKPCEADEKGCYSDVSPIPNDSAHVMENTIHPSLVVTAPEFSCGNEEEGCEEVESDVESLTDREEGCQEVESVKDSLTGEEEGCQEVKSVTDSLTGEEEGSQEVESRKECQMNELKKGVSIDHALASALAGFLTSTSEKSQKCSQSLAVKAPEFPDEEENDNNKTVLPRIQSETTNESTCLSEPDRIEHDRVVYSSLSLSSSAGSEKNVMPFPVNEISQRLGESADKQCQDNNIEEGGGSQDTCIEDGNTPDTNFFGRNDSDDTLNDLNNDKQSWKITDNSLTERPGILEQLCGDQADNGSDNSKEDAVVGEPSSSSETRKQSKEHILQNVFDFPLPGSVVDFKSPILDVKFFPQECSNAKTPLEALLDGMPDVNPEVPSEEECASDNSGSCSQVGDGCNLISVEDWGAFGSGTDNHIVVNMNYCSLKDITPVSDSNEQEKCDAGHGNHETSAASLI